MSRVDWHQLANGVAALGASWVWFRAIESAMRAKARCAVHVTVLLTVVHIWYGLLYINLGLDLYSLPMSWSVQLFRYSFTFLVVLAPTRYLLMRRNVVGLQESVYDALRD